MSFTQYRYGHKLPNSKNNPLPVNHGDGVSVGNGIAVGGGAVGVSVGSSGVTVKVGVGVSVRVGVGVSVGVGTCKFKRKSFTAEVSRVLCMVTRKVMIPGGIFVKSQLIVFSGWFNGIKLSFSKISHSAGSCPMPHSTR